MISPQLLSIKRVPIEIEISVTKPELQRIEGASSGKKPFISVSPRNNGEVLLSAEPVQLDLSAITQRKYDSFTISNSSNNAAFSFSYKGFAKIDSDGELISDDVSTPVKAKQISRSIESILNELPKVKNSTGICFDNGKLSIDYSMEDDTVFMDLFEQKFEFIPGKIEFIISQMPRLEIEYLGEPLYFPRSADPNYEPIIDVFA